QLRINAIHRVRIPRLPHLHNPSVFDPDIALYDAPMIQNHRVRNHQAQRAIFPLAQSSAALPHPVANHFPAAKRNLVPVMRKILLHLNHQFRIRQTNPIPLRWSIQIRISPPRNLQAHCSFSSPSNPNPRVFARSIALSRTPAAPSAPAPNPFPPCITRAPPNSVNSTSFSSPGSNRTAVPAAIFNRIPYAAPRSNATPRFVSKK